MFLHKIITIVMRDDLCSHLIKIILILCEALRENWLDFAFLIEDLFGHTSSTRSDRNIPTEV